MVCLWLATTYRRYRVLYHNILYPTTSCISVYIIILYLTITISRTFTFSPTRDAVVLYIVVSLMSTHYILGTISCTYILLITLYIVPLYIVPPCLLRPTSRTSYILWVRLGMVLYLVYRNSNSFAWVLYYCDNPFLAHETPLLSCFTVHW